MTLTATDVRYILAGRGSAVYDRLTGEAGPPDLSGVLSVQIGRGTERLNLDWLHRRVEGSSLHRLPTSGMVAGSIEAIGGERVVSRGIYRAKADGFLVVPDLGTIVVSPDLPELGLAAELFRRAVRHEGGDPSYSRHLRALMLEAGFARTQGIAHAPEVYGDLERTRWFAEFAVGLFSAPEMAKVIVDEGWATRDELVALLEALREWGELPDAFAAWLYCGALGWVD